MPATIHAASGARPVAPRPDAVSLLRYGEQIRVEHRANALRQGPVAVHDQVPYFFFNGGGVA